MDEVPIKGVGFRLTLRVGDYERAATGEVWDDNWLRGSVDIDIAQPPTATFRAKCDVAWQTTELQAFHESLRAVLEDLNGTAKLTTIEDQVELTIELESGNGRSLGGLRRMPSRRSNSKRRPTKASWRTRLPRSGPSSRSIRIATSPSGVVCRPRAAIEIKSQSSRAFPRNHRPRRRCRIDSHPPSPPPRRLSFHRELRRRCAQ